MGTWKFTAYPHDINGDSLGVMEGDVTGPDPVGALKHVRERVNKDTGAASVRVYMDVPEFD